MISLLITTLLQAQTIKYVRTGGNDNNAGNSWANAYRTVRKALSDAAPGTQIWIAAGTYYPDEGPGATNNDRHLNFAIKANDIGIYGGFAGSETALSQRNLSLNVTTLSGEIQQDGLANNNAYNVVRADLYLTGLVLNGLTITGGHANFTSDNPNLNKVHSGAVFFQLVTFQLQDCIFRANYAEAGGVMLINQSSGVIRNCVFQNNQAVRAGALYNLGSNNRTTDIINCIFTGNQAANDGGAVFCGSDLFKLTNCLFYENSANAGAAIFNIFNAMPVTNCIIRNNGNSPVSWNNTKPSMQHCITDFETNDNSDIVLNVDPGFINAAAGNFRLTNCSVAINRGTNAGVPTTDMEGLPRIMFGQCDIGPYEYRAAPPRLQLYVDKTKNGDGTSWSNAFRNLQDALKFANECLTVQQIWVAGGTYYPDEGMGLVNNDRILAFSGRKFLEVYGGFAGNETSVAQRNLNNAAQKTILSGNITQSPWDNTFSYHVFRATVIDKTFVLDGFTIRDGYASEVFDEIYSKGGGICLVNAGNPIFRNCTIERNFGLEAGALFVKNSTPQFINCVFTANRYLLGGVVVHDAANASYVHCTIAGNTSLSSNTTIIGNAENASPSLVNCIIAGSAQPVVGGTPQITYSLVQGETVFAGLGNRNGNPHFENEAAGNLQLTSCSWAVNAGITVNIPTTDILGRPRNAAGGVDMGAYELQTVDNSLARLYVRPAATGNGVGNSWANAFTTVAAALARANDCARVNEVWVSQGIYYPTNGTDMLATFRARSNLSVYGGFAGTESGLHQRNLANRSESVLSGNLLQDANIINNSYHVVTAATGDTMTLWDGFTIRDGFAGVTGSQRDNRGAGIFVAANNQTFFRNCIISNNTAHAASAIYAASSRAVFTNCVITNNNTQLNDGVVWNDNASPTYFYCSIASNTITGFGLTVMRNSGTSSPRITNCIIRGLSPAISGGTPMVGYSIIQNNTIWPGSSNSNADPLFVNEAAGNLRLRPCSPAINGGSPILFVNSDLLDNSRPMGGAPDIGAYERPISNILYVNATALPGGDGSSWNAALTSLQDALRILYCPAIEQIWVARGTYRPASNTNRDSAFIMRNNLAILGGFAGTETQLSQRNWRLNPAILSGDIGVPGNRSDNSHNIISNNNNNLNATAILDGFIIRDGQADKNEYARIRGGGMFNLNSSPLVRNCIFTGNFSNLYGGAVFNQGAQATPTFINCVFSGNQAQFGGGIYNESAQTQVINCTFSSNLIIGNGGGIYSYGTPKAVVRNSIVWGNAINGIFTATIDNSTPIEVSHSIVQGGYEGTNNINQNPRFTIQAPVGLGQLGDLRLLLCSPGTNAGSNAAVPAGITTDLFGLGRIVGNAVDMGAFERQTSPAGIDIYVDATATNGTNEGTSWVNAFTNLQAAINDMNFCPGTVDYLIVHIAANTYTFPPEIPIALNSQNVRIFGGYPPGGGTRNFAANPVILKGNIQALKNATIDGVRVEKP